MFDFFTPVVFANTKLMSAQRKHFDLQTPFSPYVFGKKSKNQLNIVEVFKQPLTLLEKRPKRQEKLRLLP